MSDTAGENSRKNIRYKPDGNSEVFIEFAKAQSGDTFQKDRSALSISESHTGFGLVLLNTDELQESDNIRVLLPPNDIRHAVVVWRTELDDDVLKIGIKLTPAP